MRKIFIPVILLLISPLSLAAPADGGGNKFVLNIADIGMPLDCDGDGTSDLSFDVVGWLQARIFGQVGNRNLDLTVFHFDFTFTNPMGEMLRWRDRGPDRFYFVTNDDGIPELHVAVTGRASPNIIGHVVINLDTGEFVLVAGQHPFGGEFEAPDLFGFVCNVLT